MEPDRPAGHLTCRTRHWFHGDPDRRSLAGFSVPVAILLLVVSVTATRCVLRRQWQLFRSAVADGTGWSLPAALVVLGGATIATAFVSETLIGALQAFAYTAHLSEFFVAFVIVAIIGNATEHGSAVLLARRGRVMLATEIPLASSAQIAGLVILNAWRRRGCRTTWGHEISVVFSLAPVPDGAGHAEPARRRGRVKGEMRGPPGPAERCLGSRNRRQK